MPSQEVKSNGNCSKLTVSRCSAGAVTHMPSHKVIDGRCVWHWKDVHTDALGWIVLDASLPQAAGGGLFMHSDATFEEVRDVACTMR